jgi:hypothetical protein
MSVEFIEQLTNMREVNELTGVLGEIRQNMSKSRKQYGCRILSTSSYLLITGSASWRKTSSYEFSGDSLAWSLAMVNPAAANTRSEQQVQQSACTVIC